VLTLSVFSFVLGGLLLAVAFASREQVVSPGDLSAHHTASRNRCDHCHDVGENAALTDWVHTGFSLEDRTAQSHLCRRCHEDIGSSPMHAHGMPPEKLLEITKTIESRNHNTSPGLILSLSQTLAPAPQAELQCAVCHQEHHGSESSLTELTNQQCQVCHTDAFHSFNKGHPEFYSGYPYNRREQIYFNHASHEARHFGVYQRLFPDGHAPSSCVDCHKMDPNGGKMEVRGFEQTCGACHAKQIEDGLPNDAQLFATPGITADQLAETGAQIGVWPNKASVGYNNWAAGSELSPLLALIASGDPEFVKATENLHNVTTDDLEGVTDEQRADIERLIWGVKRSVLIASNKDQLESHLAGRLGGPPATLSSVAFARLSKWRNEQFPDLAEELRTHAEKAAQPAPAEPPPTEEPPLEDPPDEEPMDSSEEGSAEAEAASDPSWGYFTSSKRSLEYRARGHADPVVKSWIEFAVSLKFAPNAKYSPAEQAAVDRLFTQWADPASTGRCMKCHTIDQSKDGGVCINWISHRPENFTRFSHSPHIDYLREEREDAAEGDASQGEEAEGQDAKGNHALECANCHKLNIENDWAEKWHEFASQFTAPNTPPKTDALQFRTSFESVSRSRCAECHRNDGARNNCLTCHNYHIHAQGDCPADK